MSPKTNDFGCFNDKKVPHYKQSTMHVMLLELYNGAGLQESSSFVLKGITGISVLILTCRWNDGGSTKKLDNQQCLIFSNMFKTKRTGSSCSENRYHYPTYNFRQKHSMSSTREIFIPWIALSTL